MKSTHIFTLLALTAAAFTSAATADEKPAGQQATNTGPKVVEKSLKRIAKDYAVWIDLEQKFVVADGKVCLTEGFLEMFACPKGTKEHESIVAIESPAQFVHAGLLAVGAKPGTPVRFAPEYAPAMGQKIDVWVLWKDKAGMSKSMKAQQWIRHKKTGKPMDYDWVFAGSGFAVDEDTGEKYYKADGGDFVCVSNFSTATLDLPVVSPQANDDLVFDAFTEHIPPQDTPVRLVFVPRVEKKIEKK